MTANLSPIGPGSSFFVVHRGGHVVADEFAEARNKTIDVQRPLCRRRYFSGGEYVDRRRHCLTRRLRLRLHFGLGFTWPFDRFAGKLRLPDHDSSRFRLIAFSSQYPPANGNSVLGWISILSFSCN